ncbi:MAG TPA: hypothetical protein VEH54_05435 [Steroidobacteraceae bacterium]|nr:hypothetical protein [Steroidobacteraceae bacterium]
MSDSKDLKPAAHPAEAAASQDRTPRPAVPDGAASGCERQRARDDAEWSWREELSQSASASWILRKLGAPDLEVEDAKDEKVRINRGPAAGGGCDPYNQPSKPRRR